MCCNFFLFNFSQYYTAVEEDEEDISKKLKTEGETNIEAKESDEEGKDSDNENLKGERDNRDIIDNNQAQAMSYKEILDLKSQGFQ